MLLAHLKCSSQFNHNHFIRFYEFYNLILNFFLESNGCVKLSECLLFSKSIRTNVIFAKSRPTERLHILTARKTYLNARKTALASLIVGKKKLHFESRHYFVLLFPLFKWISSAHSCIFTSNAINHFDFLLTCTIV